MVTSFMIAILFVAWVVLGPVQVSRQNQQILNGVHDALQAHADASAARACSSVELLAFIIRVGDRRAHELETGSYLTDDQKNRISRLVERACYEQPIPTP